MGPSRQVPPRRTRCLLPPWALGPPFPRLSWRTRQLQRGRKEGGRVQLPHPPEPYPLPPHLTFLLSSGRERRRGRHPSLGRTQLRVPFGRRAAYCRLPRCAPFHFRRLVASPPPLPPAKRPPHSEFGEVRGEEGEARRECQVGGAPLEVTYALRCQVHSTRSRRRRCEF